MLLGNSVDIFNYKSGCLSLEVKWNQSTFPQVLQSVDMLYQYTYIHTNMKKNIAIFICRLVQPLFPLMVVVTLVQWKRQRIYGAWIEGRLKDIVL